MNTAFELPYRLTDNQFRQAKTIIDRAGIDATITGYHVAKHPGGARQRGTRYTLTAVFTAALSLIMLGRTPTLKSILETIGGFTARQLAEIGMPDQDTSQIFALAGAGHREYLRFVAWLDRQLSPLDPSPDQPAKRITNAEHARIIAERTPEQRTAYALAGERLNAVVNDLVAGAIIERQPSQARGDIIADETIFDLAGPSAGLGIRPEKHRGAAYLGRYYSREGRSGPLDPKGRANGKSGFGIGLTAITRIGPPERIHSIAPVIVAIDIHQPTSGSTEALQTCITHMKRNDLDTRQPNARYWPNLIVDMGYNPKNDFHAVMLEHRYNPVVRYPQSWTLLETSANPPGTPPEQPLPGPVQFAGAFYCPAAEKLLHNHRIPKSSELLENDGWAAHDSRLAATMPFLMGTNSKPTVSGRRGRPRLGEKPRKDVKQELVCPAVQLRVRCPLKPESMTRAPFGAPLAEPTWTAEDRASCKNSITTVTLTERQLKKAQWGHYIATSWKHMIYYEAGRSRTEQQFSLLKSPHITNITDMRWGPRREPMIKILLALAVAATNHQIQKSYKPKDQRTESTDIRWRQLTHFLGHEPAQTPART